MMPFCYFRLLIVYPSKMVYPTHPSAAYVAPVVVTSLWILGNIVGLAALITVLKRLEKKDRQKLAEAQAYNRAGGAPVEQKRMEQKTVIVENRGQQGGQAVTAEVVATGPNGTTVARVPTASGGAATVSTAEAGVAGTVTVEPGKTVVVKAEHPPGKPEETKIVSTTQHSETTAAPADPAPAAPAQRP